MNDINNTNLVNMTHQELGQKLKELCCNAPNGDSVAMMKSQLLNRINGEQTKLQKKSLSFR